MVATVDFRFGIPHHYDELKKQRALRLGDSEVILLISQTKLQCAFVFKETAFDTGRPGVGEVKGVTSLRVQLSRHTPFNPLMLQNYAAELGLEIDGLKRFEDHLRAEIKEAGGSLERFPSLMDEKSALKKFAPQATAH